jgi:hypothetical protein
MVHRILHVVLIVLTSFLALTAFAGGIGLLAEINTPPLDMLAGSPFQNYVVPGLSLFFLVGGSALAAAILVLRRHPRGATVAALSAIMIIGFEVVEVLTIGSPEGIARDLQVFYFGLGFLLLLVALAYRISRPAERPRVAGQTA